MPDPGAPLVGRERELAALLELLDRARAGEASLVVLGGEAGIGKTRLIRELVGAAETGGALVLSGGCPPVAGRDLPLAPLLGAIRDFVRGASPADMAAIEPARHVLAPLIPALAGAGQPAQSEISLGLLFEHILALLERLAASRPAVVLVLEDLHWAAPSTWDLVAYLARNLSRSRLLVVCSYREDAQLADARDALVLSELQRSPTVTTIGLAGLQVEPAAALAAALGPSLAPAARANVVRRADGNPYFIGELVEAGGAELPGSIRSSVEARLAGAPEAVLRVLRVAALIGRRFDPDLLIQVVGEQADPTIAALRSAVRAGYLESLPGTEDRPDAFGFRHEVVREIVAGEVVAGERTRWHGRIARALAARLGREDAAPPERVIELATHWRASEDPLRAVPALLRAAGAAEAMYAFAEAHRLYEQAFETARSASSGAGSPAASERVLGFRPAVAAAAAGSADTAWDAGPEWAGLRARAAEAASLAGDAERAIELVDAALANPARPAAEASGWRRRRARYLLEAGRGAEAEEAYASLEADAAELPPADRARLTLAHAQALTSLGRYGDAARLASGALEVAPQDQHSLRWQALNVLGTAQTLGGEGEAGLAALDEARVLSAKRDIGTLAQPRPSRIGEVLGAQLGAVRALEVAGRSEGARALEAETAEAAKRLGAVRSSSDLDVATAWQQLRRGEWDAAAASCDALVAGGSPSAVVTEALVIRGWLRGARGAFADADLDLARAAGIGALPRPEVAARLQLALAELASWRRRHREATEAADAGVAALASTDERLLRAELCLAALRSQAELHADAVLRRAPGEALEHATAAARWLGELRAVLVERSPRAAALLATAAAEHSRLEDGGAGPWREAVAAVEPLDDPYELARVRWRLAEALLGEREGRAAAAPELRAAHAVAESLGAVPLRAELEALAARGRVELADRPSTPGAAAGTATGAPGATLGLSERELEVLALLARGRTNRQIATELFITEKTAGHHVSNILGKLGVANRLEAAAAAHRAGLVAPGE